MDTITVKPISIADMKKIEQRMVDEYGISDVIMMENAGSRIASLQRSLCNGSVVQKEITLLVGKGNNGADTMVAARHLTNWGAHIHCIVAASVSELSEHAGTQYRILSAMNASLHHAQHTSYDILKNYLNAADSIVDGLIGYNLKGNPEEPHASLIEMVNENDQPVLAVDIPSGLDADSGNPQTPTVRANTTITFALPKTGLTRPEAKEYVGNLYVADISVPEKLYEELGIEVPALFEKEEVVLLSS